MSPSTDWIETLPDPLPADPLELASQWLAQARIDAAQPNPNAMVLATADANGQPSARVVLCKDIVPETGHIVFYTNYQSRKGRELRKNPRAAIVFHWDHRHRQVRAEGHVEPLDEARNDAYFRTRAWQSRIGAWASRQSEPVASRAEMGESVAAAARRFGIPYGGPGTQEPAEVAIEVPRPPYWGGFALNVEAIELWVEGEFRIHDRARWTRERRAAPHTSAAAPAADTAAVPAPAAAAAAARPGWTATRLQP
jgi:pyridoxamine 5'-phosphate oxidase